MEIRDALALPLIEAFEAGSYDASSLVSISSHAALFSPSVKQRAARAGSAPDLATLGAHVRTQLAGHKAPRSLWLVDAVGRLPTGKPDYRWAREHAGVTAVARHRRLRGDAVRTALCDRFGIEHPIVGFAPSEHMAAAISRAGASACWAADALQNLLVSEAHQRIARADDPNAVATPVGQIVGRMNRVRPVAELMNDLLAERADALARRTRRHARPPNSPTRSPAELADAERCRGSDSAVRGCRARFPARCRGVGRRRWG